MFAEILTWFIFSGACCLILLLILLMDRLQILSKYLVFGVPKSVVPLPGKQLTIKRPKGVKPVVIKDDSPKVKPTGIEAVAGIPKKKESSKLLEGRALYMLLSGKAKTNRNKDQIEIIRKEYEKFFVQHLKDIFEKAVIDGRAKEENIPENSKTIDFATGTVFSWLPLGEVEELYELGRTAPNDRTDGFLLVRKKLEALLSRLFQSIELEGAKGLKLSSDLLNNVMVEKTDSKPKKDSMNGEVMDLLDNSNSYDDKVTVARMLGNSDTQKIAQVVKSMLNE